VAVVTVHTPSLHDAVGVSVFARATDVIDDPVRSAFLALAHFLRNFGQRLFPRNLFPFAFATFAHSLQRIQNPFRVIDLIVRRGSLGAVTSPAARVDGVAFELANLVGVLVHVSEKSACRFAVETNGRHKRVSPRYFARPFLAVPFHPFIPHIGGGILADASIGVDDFGQFDGLAVRVRELRDGGACGGLRDFGHRCRVPSVRLQVTRYKLRENLG